MQGKNKQKYRKDVAFIFNNYPQSTFKANFHYPTIRQSRKYRYCF